MVDIIAVKSAFCALHGLHEISIKLNYIYVSLLHYLNL